MTRMEKDSVDVVVNKYVAAAIAHGQATEAGNHKKANREADQLAESYRDLRSRGLDSQQALLPLLNHDNPNVRLWAGSHALEFAPAEGERVLVALQVVPGSLVGFSAKMTLQQWRAGALAFP